MFKKIVPFFLLAAFLLIIFSPMKMHADDDGVEEFKQEWNDALDEYNQGKNEQEKEEREENEVKPKDKKQGGITLLSKRYPSSHYHPVVTDDSGFWPFSSEEIAKNINSISTGLFALNKQLSEIVDASLDKFLSLDVIEKVQDTVTDASDQLWQVMKDHFAGILIVIAIVQIFVYYIAESNGMKAGRTLFKLLMIIMVAFVWVSNSGHYLTMLNHWSSQAQGYVMSAGTVLTEDVGDMEEGKEVEGSAALLRNSFFQMTVRRPYLIMNYGTTDEGKIEEEAEEGESRIDDMLALKTNEDGNEDRAELAEDEVEDKENEYMDQSSVWSKFAIALLSIGFTLFLGAPLFLLVFFNVLVQFVVLMIAFILPITFVVSILPSFANSGWHSLGRLLSTFIMKMFVSILILFVFMIFNIVDVLLPPNNVGIYFLNMTLAAILIVFMLMKRDKIVEFITAGRVVGMSGQTGAGMYSGARRATNMARTGGSHAATKSLTAATSGMAMAQMARRGFSKARDQFRGAGDESGEGQEQDKQGSDSSLGNVVDLNERRDRQQSRTPQGDNTNTQGNGESSQGQSGETNEQEMSAPASNDSTSNRSEVRSTGENEDGDSSVQPPSGTRSLSDRNQSRTHPSSSEQSNSSSNSITPPSGTGSLSDRNQSRTHSSGERSDPNPQTGGETRPPKRLTQWEAQKQVDKQKEEGRPHPGRMERTNQKSPGEKASRTNRTPQDGQSPRPSGPPSSDNKKQSNVPSQKQGKNDRKQQRKEKRRIRQETNNTVVDKAKNAAKKKRREMVDRRKRNRGRR